MIAFFPMAAFPSLQYRQKDAKALVPEQELWQNFIDA
jgi:hypothetical protein